MLEYIANFFGYSSLAPWVKPLTAFILSVLGAIFAYIGNVSPLANHIFLISLALAVAVLFEGVANQMKGLLVSLAFFHIPMGLQTIANLLDKTPYMCSFIYKEINERKSCMEERVNKMIQEPNVSNTQNQH